MTPTSRSHEVPPSLSRLGRGCVWLEEALPYAADVQAQLMGHVEVDVCVVGGGYVGLWTALALKQRSPRLDVALLDASLCGTGASGRNGGFVLSLWSKYLSLAQLAGDERARATAAASVRGIDAIGAFCERNGLQPHFRRAGWIWAATSAAQRGSWDRTVSAVGASGETHFRVLGDDEAAAMSGMRQAVGGVFERDAATVQPALLAFALRRAAIDAGVRVFEHTALRRLDRGATPVLQTDRGSVKARNVVLSMGAWLGRVRELRRSIAVIGSDMVSTRPSVTSPSRALSEGTALSDSRLLVHYLRTTADGRLAFGKGGGALPFGNRIDRSVLEPPRGRRVDQALAAFYPDLVPTVSHRWSGPVDRSVSGLPFIANLPSAPSVWVAGGFSGNGVGPSWLVGQALASLCVCLTDEWSTCALVEPPVERFPREPLRYLGGQVVRRAVARREHAFDAGGRPGPIVARLANLAPGGGLVPSQQKDAGT